MRFGELFSAAIFVTAMAVIGIARESIGWLDAIVAVFCLMSLKAAFPSKTWYKALVDKLLGDLWIVIGASVLVCLPSIVKQGHPDIFNVLQIPLAIVFFLTIVLLYEFVKRKRQY